MDLTNIDYLCKFCEAILDMSYKLQYKEKY